MIKSVVITVLISVALISLYFIFSPYQNCKRDYVNEWLDTEEERGKYVSNLDIKKRMELCVTDSSW
tara:strand:- start:49 stop:246 length:198 start_codon:yes stop_codon:yes gene_type:complete